MSYDAESLRRYCIAEAQRLTGRRYLPLYALLERADVEELLAMKRLLDDVRHEIEREKRTYQPFPGGPRIRM